MPKQTVVTRRGANHTLHVILTVCTCGLWAITGWPIAAIMGRKTKTTAYTPDPQLHPPQQYGPPPGQQPYYGPPQQQYPPQQQPGPYGPHGQQPPAGYGYPPRPPQQ